MNPVNDSPVRYDADGLVPAVVQDANTGDVLMLAFMNDEALRQTRSTGRAHYWSRSRGKLWRKGETSGNEQIVDEIRVNCEQNSLLLRVRQIGAVCHDGYDTCYYRSLGDDGALEIVRQRQFDPGVVYGQAANSTAGDPLVAATRLQFGAYRYLRDNDLTSVSGTSRRLRAPGGADHDRVADELDELAGVLDGSHRHGDTLDDVRLEASQVIYWLLLDVVRSDGEWQDLRPDRALATADDDLPPETVARLLTAEARNWRASIRPGGEHLAQAQATLALVAQACRAMKIDPLQAVEFDLAELRGRDYLAPYFASAG